MLQDMLFIIMNNKKQYDKKRNGVQHVRNIIILLYKVCETKIAWTIKPNGNSKVTVPFIHSFISLLVVALEK